MNCPKCGAAPITSPVDSKSSAYIEHGCCTVTYHGNLFIQSALCREREANAETKRKLEELERGIDDACAIIEYASTEAHRITGAEKGWNPAAYTNHGKAIAYDDALRVLRNIIPANIEISRAEHAHNKK